ncbi:TonB-dependent receptor plug domain-containing protein [Colwelliaceae bacterium 6471]
MKTNNVCRYRLIINNSITLGCAFILSISSFSSYSTEALLEELSLEDLLNITVEAATKTKETSSLSPAVMTVITAKDINQYGYASVAEALNHVAGFVDNNDLAIHNFGVRGINSGVRSGSRTIKFMIDGQAIAFRSTSQHFIGQELIPMALVERIEVIRGPVSALYGANAFLAVVNIVTKSSDTILADAPELGLAINSLDGDFNGYNLQAVFADNKNSFDYIVGASIGEYDRSGINLPKISPAYDELNIHKSSDDESHPLSFYSRLNYHFEDQSLLSLSGHYQQLNVDNPFADINPLTAGGTTRIALENMHLRADYNSSWTENISIQGYLAFGRGGTLSADKTELGAENFYLNRRLGFESIDIGAEMLMSLRENDSLLLGIDAKREYQKIETFTRIERQSFKATQLNEDRNETLDDIGVYFQYLWQINENWRAIMGLRIDDDSVIDRQTSTRFGVVGQLSHDIIIKLLAGSSFQSPSPELLYRTAIQAGDIIGNPKLRAQQAKTVELSAAVPVNDALHMSLTYFNTTVDDLVVFTSDSSNLFANNSAGSTTHGVELELRMLWQGLDAYFNYSWQQTDKDPSSFSLFVLEQNKDGDIFPEHSANAGISYHWHAQQTQISFNNRWVGARRASRLNVLYINQFYELSPYLDSTLTISTNKYEFTDGKETLIKLQVNDLFNTQYVNPGFGGIDFPSLGRQISLSLVQKF